MWFPSRAQAVRTGLFSLTGKQSPLMQDKGLLQEISESSCLTVRRAPKNPHPSGPSCSPFPVVGADLSEVSGKSQRARRGGMLFGSAGTCLGGCLGHVALLAECSGPCTVCVVTAVNDLHSVFLFLKQVFHSPYCRQNAAVASSCSLRAGWEDGPSMCPRALGEEEVRAAEPSLLTLHPAASSVGRGLLQENSIHTLPKRPVDSSRTSAC